MKITIEIPLGIGETEEKAKSWVQSLTTKDLAILAPLFQELNSYIQQELFTRIDEIRKWEIDKSTID